MMGADALRSLGRVVALAAALIAAAPALAEPPHLRIASEGARPPWNQLDGKGELIGFEIDLARALCAKIGRTCDFVQQDWDNLLPGLAAGQHDVVIAALTPTPERRARAAFGLPYMRMPLALVAPRGRKPRSVEAEALSGRTIGVEHGATWEGFLEKTYAKSQLKPYASLEEAMLDLAEGRVDLVAGPKDALAAFLDTRREGRCCRLVGDAPRDPAADAEGFAIAFRPADEILRQTFDKALTQALADGTYDAISRRYFAWPIY